MLPLIYHPDYSCPFPENHRFVMSKFRRLYDFAQESGLIQQDHSNLFQPEAASLDDLSIAHDLNYLQQLTSDSLDRKCMLRIGLPWSEGLIKRTLLAPNGTLLTAHKALEYGLACHLAGGTHHAHRDFGSGYCMVNDLAYTALSLIQSNTVDRILIFDLDVHQGDGTAAILKDQQQIFTCSIHCEKNFPFRKSESDLDIGLPLNMEDDDYLEQVSETLDTLLERVKPDIVLYDAGVDVWQHDRLGKLNISWEGIEKRDQMVLKRCLSDAIPVATVIGGGYDTDHTRLAQRHAIILEQANGLVNRTRR
jgi:acetoin utilization deacetylase AcuC-like enzyme